MYRHVWVYWKHSNYNYKQHTDTHTHRRRHRHSIQSPLWTLRPEKRRLPPKRAVPGPTLCLPLPLPLVSSLPSSRPCVCRRCWSCTYCALAIYYVFVVVFVAAVVYGPVQKRFCALFTCAPGGNAGALGKHVWLIRFHKTQLRSPRSSARLVLTHSFIQ